MAVYRSIKIQLSYAQDGEGLAMRLYDGVPPGGKTHRA